MTQPFWKTKSLAEMSAAEWESLCDGCGKCCLIQLEDPEEGARAFTSIACRLFDGAACRCTDYANRAERVPDCVVLTPDTIGALGWMPKTCAYRLLAEGKPLPDWHPLVSGDPDSVHAYGISVRGRTVSETDVPEEDWERHIRDWPGEG
ncbi:MAG: YcgN family cysteine cluster protein [Maricaulaceae bacterium]|nr:YcgN family cysteine cluster protein [Maricaulaceae bacterium]